MSSGDHSQPKRCQTCGGAIDEKGRGDPWRKPGLTTDAAVIRDNQGVLEILLIKRGRPPHQGELAFPGGFVDYNEDPSAGVLRELKEETNLDGEAVAVVAVGGNPARDPRRHTVTILYAVKVSTNNLSTLQSGDDAAAADFYPLQDLLDKIRNDKSNNNNNPSNKKFSSVMAFDHGELLQQFALWLKRNADFYDDASSSSSSTGIPSLIAKLVV